MTQGDATSVDDSTYLVEAELAERWQIAGSTLRKWRSLGVGPVYLKLRGSIRYRLADIVRYEQNGSRAAGVSQ